MERHDGMHTSDSIHRDIEHTRHEMDRTLDEIGDRLHPKHLVDQVIDLFRSSGGESRAQAGEYVSQAARKVKQHPGPAMLAGAAALWYLMDSEEEPQRRGHARGGLPPAAWEDDYDWSTADHDEKAWSEMASESLEQMKTTIGDSSRSARDKLRAIAGSAARVSGMSPQELHAQWANLRRHSGSYVDARTGEPYEEDYESSWRSLDAVAALSSADGSHDDPSWSEKASDTLDRIGESLKSSGASAKEQLSAVTGHLSGLTSRAGRSAGHAAKSVRHAAAAGARGVARSTRRGASSVSHGVSERYSYTRDSFVESLDQHPMAVGAAFLGLGLFAGLLIPATRQENRLMGDASDRAKKKAREAGRDAMHQGQEAVSAAAAAAADQVEKEGLTPGEIAKAGRRTAEAAAGAAEKVSSGDSIK